MKHVVRVISLACIGFLLAERGIYAREHWQFWAIMACAAVIQIVSGA